MTVYILYLSALAVAVLVLIPAALIQWINLYRQIANPEDEQ
jgi:hypothetical protein